MKNSGFILPILLIYVTVAYPLIYVHNETVPPTVIMTGSEATATVPGATYVPLGEPNLPVKILNIALPPGKVASSLTFDIDREILTGGVLVRETVLTGFDTIWSKPAPVVNTMPAPADLITTGHLFGVPIAQVRIRPVSYDPSSGTLIWNKRFRLKIELSDSNPEFNEPSRVAPTSAAIRERSLHNLIDNPKALPCPVPAAEMDFLSTPVRSFPPAPGDDPVDGVVIAADYIAPLLEPLHSEIAFGVILEIVPVSDILAAYHCGSDRVERVRDFIVDAYRYWGITGVFLVGALDDIPVRFGTAIDPTSHAPVLVPTDLYFGVMDGDWNSDDDMSFGEEEEDDHLPELFVGRFQPEDTLEVTAYLEKIHTLRWELDPEFTSRWLFVGASIDGHDYRGPGLCDSIINAGPIPPDIDITKMYAFPDSTGGDVELTKSNFLDALYAGQYLIFHFEHGYRYILHTGKTTDSGSGLSIPEFMTLTNRPYYSFLHTYSCEVNPIDLNSVGAASIRSPEGGFIAILAHSRPAFTTHMNIVHHLWGENLLSSGKSIKIGEAVRGAIINYSDTGEMRYYKLITNLFGYPFLDLFIGMPKAVELETHPDTLFASDSIITALVTDSVSAEPMDSVLVTAYTSTGKYAIARTDEFGVAEIRLSPGSETEIYITASGSGALPETDTIPVATTSEACIVIDSAVFYPVGGDSDIYAEPGDTFSCKLILRNIGETSADSITIRTGCVGIIDSISCSTDIAPGASCTLSSAFTFAVQPESRGYTNLRPALAIETESHIAFDTLAINILGPEIMHYSTEYIDGGDGIPTPSEIATLSVVIKNIGPGDFHGCEADIDIAGATPLTTHFTLGEFQSGDSLELDIVLDIDSLAISADILFTFENTTSESASIELKTPPPPDSLQMKPFRTQIELSWFPPDDSTIIGYYIYRGDSLSENWTRLTEIPLTNSIFTDENLPSYTLYYYSVSSIDRWHNESRPSDTIPAWTTLPYLPPWPISVGASFQIYASPVLFDIDGDSAQEIYVAGKNYAAVWAFYGDGTDIIDSTENIDPFAVTAFDDSLPAKLAIWGSPAIGDVDGDGDYELLVNDRHPSNRIHLFDAADGSESPGWPVNVHCASLSTPVLADLDYDSLLEIVHPTFVGLEAYEATGLEFIPGSGGLFGEFEHELDGTFFCSPAIGDIDGDGCIEIVIGAPRDSLNQGTVWVFDDSGNVEPGWPVRFPYNDFNVGTPTLANFDSDTSTLEILIYSRLTGVYIFSCDGSVLPGWPITGYYFPDFVSHSAAADFDGDGTCEAVIAGSYWFGIYYADGSPMPGWPIYIGSSTSYASNPTIGDIDGDGEWEILDALGNSIFGFEISGEPLYGFPLFLDDNCFGSPTLGDVDGDGDIEIVAGCYDSKVYIWETGSPYSSRAIAWPTEKGNFQRTGVYGDHWRFENIAERKLPQTMHIRVFPNPFNSLCRIVAPANADIEIFNVSGKLVRKIEVAGKNPHSALHTPHHITWDGLDNSGKPLPSGIYLVKATTPRTTSTSKAVYIK